MKKYIYLALIIGFLYITYINTNIAGIKTVKATLLKTMEYAEYLNVSGEFENIDKTYIMLSYPVYIKDVFVKENSFINKGQAIFSIDKEKMAEVLAGKTDSNLLQQIEYNDLSQLADLKSSSVDIINIPDIIYASSDGIVTQINICPGSVVMANQQLAVLRHSDNIMAKFTLSQLDYGKINIGDNVDIVPIAFQNSHYKGIISPQNAVVKKQNTAVGSKVVVDVFASISQPDKKVSDGLQINGTIQRGDKKTIKTLDYSFINQDDNGQYVFVLDNGFAKKVYIDTGIETENCTEVKTEFTEDTVFIMNDSLKHGDRVILK